MSDKPRPGRPFKLTRQQVIDAALDLARAEGLEAVTTRRLARALRVSPMTLYSYAATKDEILELMAVAALTPFSEVSSGSCESWENQLYNLSMGLYRVIRRNPVLIELLFSPGGMTGRAVDEIRERLLYAMETAGMSQEDAFNVFGAAGAFVIGFVRVESARERRAATQREHQRALSEAEFPRLAATPSMWTDPIDEDTFRRGLRHLISGLCADLASGTEP